ncbi:hypothetical protein Cadr_000000960 [Camelus dromedarius]|uniref:Uncharacterized protein n=1 Tax=Camelus dromedarius TaxID=9838 RepID=A0A5N4EJM5_CAMDR|nr:hypothetical protein Cadr_000000960 [Camelus dromedarius]
MPPNSPLSRAGSFEERRSGEGTEGEKGRRRGRQEGTILLILTGDQPLITSHLPPTTGDLPQPLSQQVQSQGEGAGRGRAAGNLQGSANQTRPPPSLPSAQQKQTRTGMCRGKDLSDKRRLRPLSSDDNSSLKPPARQCLSSNPHPSTWLLVPSRSLVCLFSSDGFRLKGAPACLRASPRHPSQRDVAGAPDRYSRCPSPPPPAGCPVGDSPAGQVGAPGGNRLWGRLQLPQGWADTGALHTAGGDTSPPHNSWQPGQRRPRSCRHRSVRSRDGRRRRRSCRLCRSSSCYCGEGGSSAAAGSARGAGSGGVGNQRGPMRGHPHLQPLRVSPGLRLHSDSGTQWPAARQGHDRAALRRGQRRPRQRQPQPQPRPGSGRPGEPGSVCIYTMHARGSSYHRLSGLGEDRECGGRERGPAGEGWGSTSPPRALTRRSAKFLQLGPRRAGRPAGGPGGGPAADWSEVGSPLRLPAVGWWWEGMVCERLHALKAPRVPTLSPVTWPSGRGLPRPKLLWGTPT